METWIITLIAAFVFGLLGLICFICYRKYIGEKFTGWLSIFGIFASVACLILTPFAYSKGDMFFITENGITEATPVEYEGEAYYPVEVKPTINRADESTIIIDGKPYVNKEMYIATINNSEGSYQGGTTIPVLTGEKSYVTVVDESTVIIDGKTYTVKE